MFKFEKDLLNYIEKHLRIIVFIGITLAGFLIRASLRRFVSGDAACDLLPWYEQIKGAGGFQGVGEQVGTYNMLYQFLIAVMTYLPIKPLYAYKILSCVFDYLLALVAAWLIYDFSKKESVGSISREEFFSENLTLEKEKWKAVIVYGLIVLSPIVFINSALWAQCDAIYAFFIFISFLLFCKEKYAKSFIFYGIAVAFKLQAVFLFPFFLFVYFAKKNFSIIYFLIIPVSMCIVNIPCLILGRGVMEIFSLYLDQTSEYGAMSMNYPSFWYILNNEVIEEGYEFYKDAAILFTACVLAGWMISWIVSRINLRNRNMLYMAFILVYTCVLFLPSMHERYGYVYEIMGILILFYNKKTLSLLILLHGISFMTYGFYLHGSAINMSVLSVVNFIVYVSYAFVLMKQLMEENKDKLVVEA